MDHEDSLASVGFPIVFFDPNSLAVALWHQIIVFREAVPMAARRYPAFLLSWSLMEIRSSDKICTMFIWRFAVL
jgi:hypothetical protein